MLMHRRFADCLVTQVKLLSRERIQVTTVNKIVNNLTPLDIMLDNARYFRELASSAKGHDAVKYRRLAEKAERDAAPYLHPRKIKMRRGETLSRYCYV